MAAGGARARQRAGRDQRSGSTGRTLAAAGVYARSVSFSPPSWRLHRPLFFILDEHASDPGPAAPVDLANDNGRTSLQLLHRSIMLLRCGFTPVYALLGRFLPRLKAASGRPPFLAMTVRVRPTATRVHRCSFCDLAVDPALLASARASPIAGAQPCECGAVEGVPPQ